jgi:hypothetical protein
MIPQQEPDLVQSLQFQLQQPKDAFDTALVTTMLTTRASNASLRC